LRPYAAIASCLRCESRPEHRRRIVKAAHARRGHERPDPRGNGSQGLRLSPHPVHDARRAEAIRAKEVDERLSRPLLGDQLLRVEIDGRRAQALAILGGRVDPFGKGRRRPTAAAGAGVDEPLMLDDLDQPRRQVEHLTSVRLLRHRPRQAGSAMAARAGFMRHDPVGVGDPPQRIALMAPLPAAGLVGRFAKAHRLLLQPVARGRLRTRRTVLTQPALQLPILRPQGRVLRSQARVLALKLPDAPLKPSDPTPKLIQKNPNLGGNVHSCLESQSVPADSPKSKPNAHFLQTVAARTHPSLGVT
jgi:hypothetical protein